MSEWTEYKLSEIYNFSSGLSKPRSEFGFGFGFLSYKEIFNNYFVPSELNELVNSTEKEQNSCSIRRGDVFLTRTSETDEDLGMSCVALKDYPKATFNGFTKRLRPNGKVPISPEYAGFYFRTPTFRSAVSGISSITTRASLNNEMLASLSILMPSIQEQENISETLKSIHDKIDLLHRQNKTLEQIAETLFRKWFVEDADEEWDVNKLGNVFKIKIGRTPPRKEFQWFTTNPTDIKWISIKDLGNCNVYIIEASENLTKEAVVKFNIPIIPKNTVVLSFKLTVGRVAITTEEMLSNEAIAQFEVIEGSIFSSEFLYLFLKSYNFSSLGSTSSIAEAVNSQTIKDIEISIPNEKTLKEFKENTQVFFDKIRSNTDQIRGLTKLRDTLLPKLMSGEVRVKM